MRLTTIAAAGALLLAAGPAASQDGIPEGMEVVATLWCDTPEQVETVMKAHYINKVPLALAMAEINRDEPDACVRARVIVKKEGEVRRFIAGEALISVGKAQVHGVMRGPYAVMMRSQTWYSGTVVAALKEI